MDEDDELEAKDGAVMFGGWKGKESERNCLREEFKRKYYESARVIE